jgi:hypothetical protein
MLHYEERFRSPLTLHPSFQNIALFKISMDAGGGSTKCIINPVNVEKPQSLKHVNPWLEYTGKDTSHNVRKAAFEADSVVRRDLEDIMHRRCILVQVTVEVMMQVVMVKMQIKITTGTHPSHHLWN